MSMIPWARVPSIEERLTQRWTKTVGGESTFGASLVGTNILCMVPTIYHSGVQGLFLSEHNLGRFCVVKEKKKEKQRRKKQTNKTR